MVTNPCNLEGKFSRINLGSLADSELRERITEPQDLPAFLAASRVGPESCSVQAPPSSNDGPDGVLPLVCKAARACEYGHKGPILYEELPSHDHIRILEILPGLGDVVECTLHVGRLPEDKHTYEALSYPWVADSSSNPDKSAQIPIRCNGFETVVGYNLASALRRLKFTYIQNRMGGCPLH